MEHKKLGADKFFSYSVDFFKHGFKYFLLKKIETYHFQNSIILVRIFYKNNILTF